jgi:hypothetical protein
VGPRDCLEAVEETEIKLFVKPLANLVFIDTSALFVTTNFWVPVIVSFLSLFNLLYRLNYVCRDYAVLSKLLSRMTGLVCMSSPILTLQLTR